MKKQLILLMTDTTRFDMLGCYGNPDMHTPHLDALAKAGVRFEYVYTAQPVCGPARSLLFTGLFPHENGMHGNSMDLGENVKTIGQRLTENGVRCAYIGKWHLDGGDYFGNGICPPGWDEEYWYDMKRYLDELPSDEDRLRSRKGETCYQEGGIDASFTYGHRCAERALDYIERYQNEDFFLTVSLDEPHGPSLCPQPYASMYEDYVLEDTPAYHDTLENKPLFQKLWATTFKGKGKPVQAPLLLGCNSYADSELGRIIDAIHEKLPDAMIIFTSDHGAALGAHHLTAKGPSVYDEIARVPLIFEGPFCRKGEVRSHTVSHADLPATVLDYMGVRLPKVFSGKSLLPVVTQAETNEEGRAFVEFNRYERDHDGFGGYQPMRAIVTDHYKLALHLGDMDELYDVKKDPYNLVNLIDDPAYAAVRNALHDKILDWMNKTRDPFRGYQWKCRPWRAEYQPEWEVDGWTRQYDNDPGEYRQKEYETGLTMVHASRHKEKKEDTKE